MKILTIQALLALAAAASSPYAAANLQNGSFESGLAGWNSTGDAAAVSGFAPAASEHGSLQLVLTTASATFADDAPAPAAALNVSGVDATAAGGALEAFVGVVPGGLDPDAANAVQAFEGSAAAQSFTAAAGQRLSLRWNFLSNDGLPGDYAFVAIDGVLFKLADLAQAALPAGAWGLQSGYGDFVHTFATGGLHQVAFGVVDVNDFGATSALLVDAVQLSAVPEPSTGALLALGLAALGVARAKRASARA